MTQDRDSVANKIPDKISLKRSDNNCGENHVTMHIGTEYKVYNEGFDTEACHIIVA